LHVGSQRSQDTAVRLIAGAFLRKLRLRESGELVFARTRALGQTYPSTESGAHAAGRH
jgi:hypothetical protein